VASPRSPVLPGFLMPGSDVSGSALQRVIDRFPGAAVMFTPMLTGKAKSTQKLI